ncbi:MAG: proline--tRNA ligase [Oscillochloris sp.]|nr:proline--tRNA ligase [Oscillochloris sp.]
MSQLFGTTLREAPAGTEAISHQLLLRAGYVRQLGQGIFSSLPLAFRSLKKIEQILRDEMNAIGGQELLMPVVHPADIWKNTGRWYSIGPEMGRFKDRKARDMVLAVTHEEVVAQLCVSEIRSYKQLPLLIYHIQTKFRDDPRPRAGLIRVREFIMKDSYSLDLDEAGLDVQYRAHYQAYFNIFNRCTLPVIAVGSDVGMMGGSLAHEYMYLTPVGEDTLVLCRNCGYAANRQVATFAKTPTRAEESLALERIATPNAATIDELCALLAIPRTRTAKAVMMVASHEENEGTREQFVFAVVRGDMELNETKLSNLVQADGLRPATEEEIRAVGAVPGYASPIGLRNATVVVDEIIPQSANLVIGANAAGYHMRHLNVPRDFRPDYVADIAAAGDGFGCIQCGEPLYTSRGVEVGNIFKLGTRYTSAVNATYLDANGEQQPVVMGSYGIGTGRLLACVAEHHNDERGLCMPISIAPFHVHLVVLAGKNPAVKQAADQLYAQLLAADVEVLYDDRDERAGLKFTDADLIGLPIRVTLSGKTFENAAIEIKRRDQDNLDLIPLADALATIEHLIAAMFAEIAAGMTEVPFH